MANEKRNGLTLLKGLAAFGIVGCHLFLAPMTESAERLLHFCDLNVALFGGVSGFLLAASFERHSKDSLWALIVRRFRRIVPVYAVWTMVFLIASIITSVVLRHEGIPARYYTATFWFSAVFGGGSSTHLWYLAFLFWWSLVLLSIWRSIRLTRAGLTMLLVSSATLVYCVLNDGMSTAYSWRLMIFMAQGASLYLWRSQLRRLPVAILLAVVAGALVLHLVMPVHRFVRDWVVTLAVVPLFAREGWKTNRFVETLGANSLGVYLVHPLLTMASSLACFRMFGRPIGVGVLLADWLFVCVLASAFSWIMRQSPKTKWMVS